MHNLEQTWTIPEELTNPMLFFKKATSLEHAPIFAMTPRHRVVVRCYQIAMCACRRRGIFCAVCDVSDFMLTLTVLTSIVPSGVNCIAAMPTTYQ